MKLSPSRDVMVALIVACSLFMENLDSTVIATALPKIAADIHVDPIRLSLGITAYLLSLAVFIPVSGWFADRFGARTIFRTAIIVFALGSLFCAASQNLWELTAARIVQGIGGAMMVPVGRLVLVRSVSKDQLLRAMSYVTTPALLGPVIGPPLGGFIVTYASWRWIFLINLPIALLGIVLVTRYIENIKEPDTPPLDVRGFILSGVGLTCLIYGFETAGRGGVPLPVAISLLAVGAVTTLLYVRHALHYPAPVLDVTLLKVPTFFVAVVGGSLFRIGIAAIPFLLPLLLQLGFGMSPFASGLLTFSSAAGALFMKMTAKPILNRLGFRIVLTGNAVLSSAFLFSYGLIGRSTPSLVIFTLLLGGGFFRSLQFTSTNTLAFADIPGPRMSRATSFSSTMQQLSMSVGVAVGAMLLHITLNGRDSSTLTIADFSPAFVTVGIVSLASLAVFMRLKPDAGAEITGRRIPATPGASMVTETSADGTPQIATPQITSGISTAAAATTGARSG